MSGKKMNPQDLRSVNFDLGRAIFSHFLKSRSEPTMMMLLCWMRYDKK